MDNMAFGLMKKSLAPSTRDTYRLAIDNFTYFKHTYIPGVPILPASTLEMVRFVSYLQLSGKAAATIATYVSAISFFHKVGDLPDPTNKFVIRKMLRGSTVMSPSSDSRLPILPPLLMELVKATLLLNGESYNGVMLAAMFLLAFFAFLRVGEITTHSVTESRNVLHFDDISLIREEGVLRCHLTFRHFKHHKGQPVTLTINPQRLAYCPVAMMARYLAQRGSSPGPLFTFNDMAPVRRSFFTSQLKAALVQCGLGAANYKSHSFRIGAASYACQRGCSDVDIQQMGRWKSNAYKRYIRIPTFQNV